MQLSIIIVNYNVRHFLEQCLHSVQRAAAALSQVEIIVVDNHSTDNSITYLSPRFPQVNFIANQDNQGFAKACNQGFGKSTGEHILFLNPDTIVPEDCFIKCINFFASHADAGALGVKMIDGSGHFLRESKRSFPSPVTSLYKLVGLTRLFPHNKIFARYHLGNLPENEINSVDVLAGAFMMVRRHALEQTGGFDEVFFMYGEDVDLSFRIQEIVSPLTNSHYKNYYFPETCIIHFKGESTRKGSLNYVRLFYNAMSLFVKKHYGGKRAGLFNSLIHIAIWLRAAFTAISHFIQRIGLPIIDAVFIFISFWMAKSFWENYIRPELHYDIKLLWIAFPAFTIFFLICAYYAGLYDKGYRRRQLTHATALATVSLIAAYSMLPEQYRFSRGIIVLGSLFSYISLRFLRWVFTQLGILKNNRDSWPQTHILVAGSPDEYGQALQLLAEANLPEKVLGRIAVSDDDLTAMGNLNRMNQLSRIVPFKEIIYCAGVGSYKQIITSLQSLSPLIHAKFYAVGSGSIIGSNEKDTAGESLSISNNFKLAIPYNRRIKRLIDVLLAIFGVVFFPIHLFFVKSPVSFLRNCLQIITARKTWVGYAVPEPSLPQLRQAVLASNGQPARMVHNLPVESLHKIDEWYARDYEPMNDLRSIVKSYRLLGN